jgi:hypothetical protein
VTADDVTQRLAEMRDRSEKATGGPWFVENSNALPQMDGSIGEPRWFVDSNPTLITYGPMVHADAEFIAHARTDLDDLRGAVEDVLALAEEWDAIPDQVLVRRAATIRLRRAITARLGGA